MRDNVTDAEFFAANPKRWVRLRPLQPGESALDTPKPPLQWFIASIRFGKRLLVEMRADTHPELFDDNTADCVVELLREFDYARRGV